MINESEFSRSDYRRRQRMIIYLIIAQKNNHAVSTHVYLSPLVKAISEGSLEIFPKERFNQLIIDAKLTF